MINTVAVIGGSGFVGRATVERLARLGKQVIVLCRNSERAKYLKPMGNVGQITLVAGNALDEAVLDSVIRPADAVVNLVGILAEGGGQRFDELRAQLPERFGALATKHGLQSVVHVSAIGADEQALAHYSQSKGLGERQVTEAFKNATIIRPSILFGPEDKFFNFFAGIARLAPALPLIGGGHTRFQPVYVCDAAEAIVAALSDTSSVGRTYEIGGPETYSFRELMDIMLGVIKRRRLLLPVPFWATAMDGAFIETSLNVLAKFAGTIVPAPPITQDQVRLLRSDNVVSGDMPGLAELGITPTALDVILPTYLARYRRGGSKKDELSASVSRH